MKRCRTSSLVAAIRPATHHWLSYPQHALMLRGFLAYDDIKALASCHREMGEFAKFVAQRFEGEWDEEMPQPKRDVVLEADMMLGHDADLSTLHNVSRMTLTSEEHIDEPLSITFPSKLTALSVNGTFNLTSLPSSLVELDLVDNNRYAPFGDISANENLRCLKVGVWSSIHSLPRKLRTLKMSLLGDLDECCMPESLLNLNLRVCQSNCSLNGLPIHLRVLELNIHTDVPFALPSLLMEFHLTPGSSVVRFAKLPTTLEVLSFDGSDILPTTPNNIKTLYIQTNGQTDNTDMGLAAKCPNVTTLHVACVFDSDFRFSTRREPAVSRYLATLPLAKVETFEFTTVEWREKVHIDFTVMPALRSLVFHAQHYHDLDLSKCTALVRLKTSMHALLPAVLPRNHLQHLTVVAAEPVLRSIAMPTKTLTLIVPCIHERATGRTVLNPTHIPRDLSLLSIQTDCRCGYWFDKRKGIQFNDEHYDNLNLTRAEIATIRSLSI